MGYIQSGKDAGAKVETGGDRLGSEGYFIAPTVFTNTTPDMKIVREEIFGPVGVVIKFKDEEDVIRQANDTVYGLAAAVFTQNLNRAIKTAHRLKAGTAWINCVNQVNSNVPFGGFKQSGIGRELGEYALHKCDFSSVPCDAVCLLREPGFQLHRRQGRSYQPRHQDVKHRENETKSSSTRMYPTFTADHLYRQCTNIYLYRYVV